MKWYYRFRVYRFRVRVKLHSNFTLTLITIPKVRPRQPVNEIAKELASLMQIPCCESLLVKTSITPAMKDIAVREEKISTLIRAFTVYNVLPEGKHDVLIIDDIFDTGSSLEAATHVLKSYSKFGNIYVATVTRKM